MGLWAGLRLGPERSAAVKKQSGINGLLSQAGPFHLFRLQLDLRSDVLKEGNCHFSRRKSALAFSGSQLRHSLNGNSINALKFYHQKIPTLIPITSSKSVKSAEICGSISEFRFNLGCWESPRGIPLRPTGSSLRY